MTATSRKAARSALATLLNTALVGSGKPLQVAYGYPPADFVESPLLFIRSAGTITQRRGIGQTKGFNRFILEVVIYVAAANNDPGWTPAAAADALDDIEAGVREVILTNPTNAAWANLILADQVSEIYHLTADQAGGTPFDAEILRVEVEVYDT
jgi:hypothetical protein